MSKINVKKIKIKGKEKDKPICGIECIYTGDYIHKNQRKPEYMYFSVMYDDNNNPCSICLDVWVNNCGTIIIKREFLEVFDEITKIFERKYYELSKEEIAELYDNSNLFEMEANEIMIDNNNVLQTFTVEKEWTNGKFKCKVVKMTPGYRCAYVGVTKENPFFKKKHFQLVEIEGTEVYFNDEIKTAHQINYSDFTDDNDYWYFGFDCLNNGCRNNICLNTLDSNMDDELEDFSSLEFCIQECNSICQQIRDLLLILKLSGRKNS